MILAVDIGNTDIVVGTWSGKDWIQNWRTPSKLDATALDFETIFRTFFLESNLKSSDVNGVVLSSVVPVLTELLVTVMQNLTSQKALVVNPSIIRQLNIGSFVNPNQIGSDLVANAVGAYDRFHTNAIVVDFGTALTFTSINEQGEMMGVAISPGVRTAMKSLSANTAKLPEIALEIPANFIGTNTIEAMQSGIMQGYVGLVRHMVTETSKQHTQPPKVIATGGLSFVFSPLHDVFDEIDVNLTLNGLLVIYQRNE